VGGRGQAFNGKSQAVGMARHDFLGFYWDFVWVCSGICGLIESGWFVLRVGCILLRLRGCEHVDGRCEIGDWGLEWARFQASPYIFFKALRHG
jgi:hypothetical protein